MRKSITPSDVKHILYLCLFSVTILLLSLPGLYAQKYATITGKLTDKINNDSIPFANLMLFRTSDSKLIHGAISDIKGCFAFSYVETGNYFLKASIIGYEPVTIEINIAGNTHYDAGTLLLSQNTISLGEAVVMADRLKGRSEKEKTAYFITKKMSESSNNGLDIIKLIPGVQVDLMRNISLNGSQSILVLVDGKERDKNFVSQIIPDHIDKVEIIESPPAGYDGDVTGVINIVLKSGKNSGASGQINLELPASKSLHYIHPDYSLSFSLKKLNFFTSYNGEMIHFDQTESNFRRIKKEDTYYETRSDQYVVQKTWSHHFHYGVDYSINPKNVLSFYAFYNPYSQEYNGKAKAVSEINNYRQWEALRKNNDINRSTFYSLFLKHSFKEKGCELTFDISNYHLTGENVATYKPVSDETGELENTSKPYQNAVNLKADFTLPLGHNLTFGSGARIRTYHMQDKTADSFRYSGETFSAYSTIGQSGSNLGWNLGLRAEKSNSDLRHGFHKNYFNLLPSASLNYKISTDRALKFAFSNTVNRPNIYHLNPTVSEDDPFTIHRGNPLLDPEKRTSVSVEYSQKFNSNFGSVRLFYNRTCNAINYVIFLNDTSLFETHTENLGTLHQTGFLFSGTFKIGRLITFIPYLRLYAQFTEGNHIADEFSINNRSQIVVEPGFSSLISLKPDINIAMNFQYGSPRNNISGNNYSDPLYMISVEKIFKNGIKAGIASALPFTKSFTYQGSEVNIQDFYGKYTGDINLSKKLLWFKISYQFNSGRKHESLNHGLEEIDAVPKKGF